MKKPARIYWYAHKKIESHEIGPDCAPQKQTTDHFGERWRCRHHCGGGDFYGYEQRKAAKAAEIVETRLEIGRLEAHLKKLTEKPE